MNLYTFPPCLEIVVSPIKHAHATANQVRRGNPAAANKSVRAFRQLRAAIERTFRKRATESLRRNYRFSSDRFGLTMARKNTVR